MARDRDRKRIGAAGLRDRTDSFRLADGAGDLRVGRRLARRDGTQRRPHSLLERGAADVERKIKPLTGRLDKANNLKLYTQNDPPLANATFDVR